jgi:hypothetical protein
LHLDSFAVADKKISQVISDIALQVYEQLSTTAKTNINQAIKSDDITKAKELAKTFVHATTGFDDKATVKLTKSPLHLSFMMIIKLKSLTGLNIQKLKYLLNSVMAWISQYFRA